MGSMTWKIALRTLARDRAYALINVAGLAIAIACCLIFFIACLGLFGLAAFMTARRGSRA